MSSIVEHNWVFGAEFKKKSYTHKSWLIFKTSRLHEVCVIPILLQGYTVQWFDELFHKCSCLTSLSRDVRGNISICPPQFFLALTWLHIGAQDYFICAVQWITTTKIDILKVDRHSFDTTPNIADMTLLLWNTCLFQSFNSKAVKLGIGNVSEHKSEQLTSCLAGVRAM